MQLTNNNINNNNVTVENLRKSGHRVRVKHSRYERVLEPKLMRYNPPVLELKPQKEIPGELRYAKGGQTTVEVTTPDNREFSATAKCNLSDSFNRKIGVQICLGRIMKSLSV